jgi:hypothetical protein
MSGAPCTLDDLASAPRWVAWQTETPEGRPKPTKMPYAPAGSGYAKADDARTWGTREAAETRAARLPRPFDAGGVGFELGDLGNGRAIGGLDLDSCRDPETGSIEPWAAEVIRRFGSYAEVSPSGTGAKVFFTYDPAGLPDLLRLMGTRTGKKWASAKGEHAPAIELYLTGRYFAVTGERLPDSPPDLRPASPETLRRLIQTDGPAFARKPAQEAADAAPTVGAAGNPRRDVAALPGAARLLLGDFAHLTDTTRSGIAMAMCRVLKRGGWVFEDAAAFLREWEHTAEWCAEKGDPSNARELRRAWQNCTAQPGTAGAEFSSVGSAIRLLTPAECDAAEGREYLVKGLLARGDVACLFGAPGAGKSVVAPHLAYAVAQGRPVFGYRTRPGTVFYVAAEDPHGMRQRIRALRLREGDADGFKLVEGVGNLLDPEQAGALRALVAEHKPALIVVDTLAMACPGIDENTSADMGRVVAMARSLTEHGAAVALIHHDSKAGDATPRGHSILNGALDVSLHLVRAGEDGVVRGKLVKNRNGACDETIAFRIAAVNVGTDEDGDAVTAPIAQELATAHAKPDKLPRAAKAALEVLREQVALIGKPMPDGTVAVPETEWRRECDDRRISTSDDREGRSKAFRRAFAELLDRKLIATRGGMVWATGPGDEFAAMPGVPIQAVEADEIAALVRDHAQQQPPGHSGQTRTMSGMSGRQIVEAPGHSGHVPLGRVRMSGPAMLDNEHGYWREVGPAERVAPGQPHRSNPATGRPEVWATLDDLL